MTPKAQKAIQHLIRLEGGYTVHEVPGDTGGRTCAGISQKWNPDWEGWFLIDTAREATVLHRAIEQFYFDNYWQHLRLSEVQHSTVGTSILAFAVHHGKESAVRVVQTVVGATPDGVIGPATLSKINLLPADLFDARFCVACIAVYERIVTKNPSQRKFFLGWVRRALQGMSD